MNLPLEVSSWNIPEKLLRTTGDQKVRFSQNDSPKSILIEELGNINQWRPVGHSPLPKVTKYFLRIMESVL